MITTRVHRGCFTLKAPVEEYPHLLSSFLVLIENRKIFVMSILCDNLSGCRTVLSCKSLIQTVLHDVLERIQV